MPRKAQGWITFQASEEERQLLEAYCQRSHRTKTEVLRELVRSLDPQTSQSDQRGQPKSDADGFQLPAKPLKISSRNLLKGRIKRIAAGAINSEITLEIVHSVELVSIITRSSVEQLALAEGKEAYAVIKSSDVAIAVD